MSYNFSKYIILFLLSLTTLHSAAQKTLNGYIIYKFSTDGVFDDILSVNFVAEQSGSTFRLYNRIDGNSIKKKTAKRIEESRFYSEREIFKKGRLFDSIPPTSPFRQFFFDYNFFYRTNNLNDSFVLIVQKVQLTAYSFLKVPYQPKKIIIVRKFKEIPVNKDDSGYLKEYEFVGQKILRINELD
jgi:hypothetical protein